ncbi:39S ribosomal protein L13, mitochondrial [Intoshia linei]|uniref:39S ribosomal protein L13, mitochondrial n=1 Tax=Intoshia linei TaxID=1819745 RepID=A0A177BDL4_9BILA|nr:39S ribosomal protein L13, mitochondrial [Intoshia linei]
MNQLRTQQWATFTRVWYEFDAYHQCPFLSAKLITKFLEGRHKPIYHRYGFLFVCLNILYAKLKKFTRTAWVTHKLDPTEVIRKAIYSRMFNHLIRKTDMERLHIFPEAIPDNIQKRIDYKLPKVMNIEKSLDQYSQDEIDKFPRLFKSPKYYVMDPSERCEDNAKDVSFEFIEK